MKSTNYSIIKCKILKVEYYSYENKLTTNVFSHVNNIHNRFIFIFKFKI